MELFEKKLLFLFILTELALIGILVAMGAPLLLAILGAIVFTVLILGFNIFLDKFLRWFLND